MVLIALIGLLLAYANGANDNFKGVATLLGSGTASYRRALIFGTTATALGSLAAWIFSQSLLAAFSGKGLVPAEVVSNPAFPAAVAFAAGSTVLLATLFGFPISTTHALVGGLVGAGLAVSPVGVDFSALGAGFVLPLVTSPFLAVLLALLLYPALRSLRKRMGVNEETCLCVGREVIAVVPGAHESAGSPLVAQALAAAGTRVSMAVEERAVCRVRYGGKLLGIDARLALDAAHYLSAGAVSFARGLNDTPKIAALLLVGGALSPAAALVAVGLAIAIGGWVSANRVADTLSRRVTTMNAGQGFTANLVTSLLVLVATRFGLPVSTTHVSCGALFGIGTVTRRANWSTIGRIVLAWVITLPLAGVLGAVFAWLFARWM